MKSFSIQQVLVYNPTLKSQKKKPIQSDIQQAKIVAYFPADAPIEQKCNTEGMAEGVYEFNKSLLSQQQSKNCAKHFVIFLDNCCLVQKEVELDTWLFLKLSYQQKQTHFMKYSEEEENTYIDNLFSEQIALNIVEHLYFSFHIFYGPFSAFVFLKKQTELTQILKNFLISYEENNKLEETKKLDASSYFFNSIRTFPLDINSTLKFNYFKNVLENYDTSLQELIVFSHGLVAFSTLPKETTAFFQSYLFGIGEPFKFQQYAYRKKMKQLNQITELAQNNKYGTYFNSLKFGLGNKQLDEKIRVSLSPSYSASQLKRLSSSPVQSQSQSQSHSIDQDLLGLIEAESLAFPIVHINKNGENKKYKMTYFFQKKLVFVTFYKDLHSREQIIFQNKFYFDNVGKFQFKMNEIMNNIQNQQDMFKFLYCNLNTFTGKISIERWSLFVPEMRYLWSVIEKEKESQVATTIQNHWVYGIHRLNRVLVLLMPSEVPLHKLDDFADKMFKQYFVKAFM